MLKQVLSLQVLKHLFQAPGNKLYNKGVSLLLNTMGKGIHLFFSLKHFPKKKRGQWYLYKSDFDEMLKKQRSPIHDNISYPELR